MANGLEVLSDVCLSGGADGADLQFGMCAGTAGHTVIHWSFDGHNTDCPAQERVVLSESQLKEADDILPIVAKRLKRVVPSLKRTRNLLRRNFYQINTAERVYAVASIGDDGKVNGGTGWAVEMYKLRHDDRPPELYVFDQSDGLWYIWNDRFWSRIDAPPKPHGVWAGIGSRELQTNGKEAIRTLLGYVKPQ